MWFDSVFEWMRDWGYLEVWLVVGVSGSAERLQFYALDSFGFTVSMVRIWSHE